MTVLTLAALPPRRAERIRGILRAWNLPWIEGVPEIPADKLPGNRFAWGYLYLTIFPCGGLYLGMRAGPFDARYFGSGSSDGFKLAASAPRNKIIVVVLGVFSRKPGLRSLRKMEVHYLRQVGIPLPGKGEPCPPPWLNRWAHNGGPANATPESRSANGKISGRKNVESGHLASIASMGGRKNVESGQLASIRGMGGKIGGKISGPASVRNMKVIKAALRDGNDPTFWEKTLPHLPEVQPPPGFNRDAARYGFDIPDEATIHALARPLAHWNARSNGKMATVLLTTYECDGLTFAEFKRRLAAAFPGDPYGSAHSARVGLTRDCRKGLFELRLGGRVLLGPDTPQRAAGDTLETGVAAPPHP